MTAAALPKPYLQDRHFNMALGTAAALHILAFTIWIILPKTEVVEVPIRSLNIKLGESEDIVDPGIKAAPINPNEASARSVPKPMAADQEVVAAALDKAMKTSRDALNKLKIAEQPRVQKPVPKAEVKKPEPKSPPPPAAKPEAQQYVRQQVYDYKNLPAPAPAPAAAGAGGGSTLGNSAGSQAEIIARYEQLISAWIQQYKIYPPEARASGIQGEAILRIRIDRHGNVRYSGLDQSTQYQQLNQAVMEMIQKANPLPPVPPDYKSGDLLEFKIPVSFKLK